MSLNADIGSASSESYTSVAEADAYHLARGNTPWADATFSVTEKEQSLRRATDFMEQVYRLNWLGYRVNNTQALSWPRNDVLKDNYYYYPNDTIPTEVKNACCELASKAAAGDLSPDIAQRVIREKVGVLEVDYAANSPQYTTYRAINNMLAPLLGGIGGAFRKVVRT